MKKFTLIFTLTLLFLVSFGTAWGGELPKPTSPIYTQDFAQVLSPETTSRLNSLGAQLDQQTGAQVVVVTVPSLEDQPIEDYALNLLRTWGVGDKKQNNGIVLLFAQKEREIRIEVGYGLEGALPDGKTGRFLDELAIPYFQQQQYDLGIYNTYLALVQEAAKEYGVAVTNDNPVYPTQPKTKTSLPDWAYPIIVILVVILIILDFKLTGGVLTYFLLSALGRGRGGGGGGGGFGGGSGGGGGSSRKW